MYPSGYYLLLLTHLLAGMDSVKQKYEFIWQGKEEEVAYPSMILDDFLYLGDEACSLNKV